MVPGPCAQREAAATKLAVCLWRSRKEFWVMENYLLKRVNRTAGPGDEVKLLEEEYNSTRLKRMLREKPLPL